MVNYECKKLQIKAHLEKYKAFKNGCEEYKITEEDYRREHKKQANTTHCCESALGSVADAQWRRRH